MQTYTNKTVPNKVGIFVTILSMSLEELRDSNQHHNLTMH